MHKSLVDLDLPVLRYFSDPPDVGASLVVDEPWRVGESGVRKGFSVTTGVDNGHPVNFVAGYRSLQAPLLCIVMWAARIG